MSNISRYLLKSVYAISHKKVENYITFYTNLLIPEVEVRILLLMKGGADFFFFNFVARTIFKRWQYPSNSPTEN